MPRATAHPNQETEQVVEPQRFEISLDATEILTLRAFFQLLDKWDREESDGNSHLR